MIARLIRVGLLFSLLALWLPAWLAGAEVCDLVYFLEPDCPDCAAVNQMVLPRLVKQYGARLRIHRRDVSDPVHFEAMMGFELTYGMKPQEVPEFYTAHGVTWQPAKIAGELPALIDRELSGTELGSQAEFLRHYLAQGNTGIPVAQVLAEQYRPRPPLAVHEFRKPGCKSCSRVTLSLNYLAQRYPQGIRRFSHSLQDPEAQVLLQAFCLSYGIPEAQHLVAPAVFCGKLGLVGKAAFRERDLVREIGALLQQPDAVTNEPTVAELAQAKAVINARFSRIAWPAVIAAGLLDGVNPCAFVTIIFLLSYLTLQKYSRRDAMLVGTAFTAAVFVTYLLIGIGCLAFISYLQELPYFRSAIYGLAVGTAILVGLLNLRDAWRIRHGSLADLELKLGEGLRQRINAVIRRQVRLRHFILGAMLIGAAVSVLELACTGQVYLPTILFMLKTHGASGRALLLLIGYNLAFIAPLAMVFVLYGYGTTSQVFSQWLTRNGVWIKFGTGALFLGLAALMLISS